MSANNPGSDFVSRLVELTNSDKLIWENHTGKKHDFDIGYCSPWMFCLDDGNNHRHPLLQVARSYHCFAELEGIEYGLGSLINAIASQRCRFRRKPVNQPSSIKEGKVKKFLRDKLLRDKRENLFREKVLSICQQALNMSPKDLNGT